MPSMQHWLTSQVDFRGLFDNGDLLLWSGVHDECTLVQKPERGFLSLAPYSSRLFGHFSFLSDLLPATHPALFPLFTYPPRNLSNQSCLFSLYDMASWSSVMV